MLYSNEILALNKKAWNNIAAKYEKYRPKWLEEPSILFDYFCSKLIPGSYILDIGSGTGLPYAKSLTEHGFKVLGIDISEDMIEISKKNVPKAQFERISMTEINYYNKFDGALSSFSMLMLNPIQFRDVAKRIIKAIKKNGLFYLSLNEPWEECIDVDKEVIIEIMGEKMYSRAYTKEEVLETFTPFNMTLLKFNREIQKSKLFGIEHTTIYIFKKV